MASAAFLLPAGGLGAASRGLLAARPQSAVRSAFIPAPFAAARPARAASSALMMATSTYKVVVLGGGNAAGYVAKSLVEASPDTSLCIVGREEVLPYERPALSKAFLFADPPARLPGFHTSVGGGGVRQDAAWYADAGVDVKLSTEVTGVDVATKTLTTAAGDTVVAEDALIIATGAAPIALTKTPGWELDGVYTLRENAEGLRLYDALKAAKGEPVVVVGGGYIGMEVAAAAATMGCQVKMIYPDKHMMPRLFTPEIASHYEKYYTDKGIELLYDGRLCEEILGDDDGKVRGVIMCKDGEKTEVAAKVVVVGVGAKANTQLVEGAVDMEAGGIKVNGSLESSAAGVYAIGDVATFPLAMTGGMTRMEHVQNARETAAHAVASILGKASGDYDYLPYFYSRVFDLGWKFYGRNEGTSVTVGNLKDGLASVWVDGGKAVGVFMEGGSDADTAAMVALARKCPAVDVEALKAATSAAELLAACA